MRKGKKGRNVSLSEVEDSPYGEIVTYCTRFDCAQRDILLIL